MVINNKFCENINDFVINDTFMTLEEYESEEIGLLMRAFSPDMCMGIMRCTFHSDGMFC